MPVETEEVAAPPPPPAVPIPPQRRPRVREVSSRFMSPVSSSHSSGDHSRSPLHKQHHLQRQRQQSEPEVDENIPAVAPCDTPRASLESPFINITTVQKKHRHSRTYSDTSKLFGRSTANNTPLRPDTPTIERTSSLPSSTIRLNHRTANVPATAKASAAAKLLQSSGIGLSSKPNASSSSSQEPSVNESGRTALSLIDLGTSLPEADNNGDGAEPSFKLSRSLNSPLLSSDPSLFHLPNGLMKGKSAKVTPFSLPPVPSHTKHGTDTVRGSKKISRHQEDLHSLKLLYNCYLQWRFANAKAENSTQIQKRETERILYSLEVKISELYDCVRRKRMELQLLQRMKTLSNILESHMPYLEEWSTFQRDYLNSLSEAIQSLLNISLRLPINGNVKVDTREVGEAMTSAIKMMEMIVSNVQSFMPKAEEMESSVSELARVAIGERAVIEECGDLFYKTNTFQVEDCSLRAQLIQLQAMGSCTNKLLLQE
uniref:Protein ENDOSPERM DEFECTIVE 1 n=1 Tax=Gossypium raimondii TaxID=29730 RepID=A0A0D2TEL8_GOSRA|nr:hypothetical protein B456_008G287300 [Gossypium raimondii]